MEAMYRVGMLLLMLFAPVILTLFTSWIEMKSWRSSSAARSQRSCRRSSSSCSPAALDQAQDTEAGKETSIGDDDFPSFEEWMAEIKRYSESGLDNLEVRREKLRTELIELDQRIAAAHIAITGKRSMQPLPSRDRLDGTSVRALFAALGYPNPEAIARLTGGGLLPIRHQLDGNRPLTPELLSHLEAEHQKLAEHLIGSTNLAWPPADHDATWWWHTRGIQLLFK